MLTYRFRQLLEDYQRKRWFPHRYREPLGDLTDFVNRETIERFAEDARKSGNRSLHSVAYYLYAILPSVRFPDLIRAIQRAYSQQLHESNARADNAFYYLRKLSEDESRQIWKSLQDWIDRNTDILEEWLRAHHNLEGAFREFRSDYFKTVGVDLHREIAAAEEGLRISADLFEWKCNQRLKSAALINWISYFRLAWADELADWNDFGSFGNAIALSGQLQRKPRMKRNRDEESIQYVFPISAPKRVVQEYGASAGVFDMTRFLYAFGAGCFYAGMNPELSAEDRICGDPTLPVFWSSLFCQVMIDTGLLEVLVTRQSAQLAEELRFAIEFFYRHQALLAICQNQIGSDLTRMDDAYLSSFKKALPSIDPVPSLTPFEMVNAGESFFRVIAQQSAVAAAEQFKILYGKKWFYSANFAARCRDYWWEGFRLTRQQILDDLRLPSPPPYPFAV